MKAWSKRLVSTKTVFHAVSKIKVQSVYSVQIESGLKLGFSYSSKVLLNNNM